MVTTIGGVKLNRAEIHFFVLLCVICGQMNYIELKRTQQFETFRVGTLYVLGTTCSFAFVFFCYVKLDTILKAKLRLREAPSPTEKV